LSEPVASSKLTSTEKLTSISTKLTMPETNPLPNLLQIHIEEPTSNPDQPSDHHNLADDLPTAEKRYRTILQVLIQQLTGLQNTHVRFIVTPAIPEAVDAVAFWLLPLFRGKVSKLGEYYHFSPEQHASEFTIEFTSNTEPNTSDYEKCATLSAYCPECSSRWINAAMMQCSEDTTVQGGDYLSIQHKTQKSGDCTPLPLPHIPIIKNKNDWEITINPNSPAPSPIGPKLRKIYQDL